MRVQETIMLPVSLEARESYTVSDPDLYNGNNKLVMLLLSIYCGSIRTITIIMGQRYLLF